MLERARNEKISDSASRDSAVFPFNCDSRFTYNLYCRRQSIAIIAQPTAIKNRDACRTSGFWTDLEPKFRLITPSRLSTPSNLEGNGHLFRLQMPTFLQTIPGQHWTLHSMYCLCPIMRVNATSCIRQLHTLEYTAWRFTNCQWI